MSVQNQIDNIMEDLILLCEVRGELDEKGNQRIETKIQELTDELATLKQVLQFEQDRAIFDASCYL